MKDPIDTLLRFRVRDVMRNEVVTVQEKDTMEHAAAVLHSYGISGAPVVNVAGKCVGMLSSTDFVQRELTSASVPNSKDLTFDSMYIKKPFAAPESIAAHHVEAYMTPLVQTIAGDQPMMRAARLLCEDRIHRLVVVDKQDRPVGILSSLDVVACMVVAIEE